MEKVVYKGPKEEFYDYKNFDGRLIDLGAEFVCDSREGYTGVYHFHGTTILNNDWDDIKHIVELKLFGDEKTIGEIEKLILPILK